MVTEPVTDGKAFGVPVSFERETNRQVRCRASPGSSGG
jgi:hypothetical protein